MPSPRRCYDLFQQRRRTPARRCHRHALGAVDAHYRVVVDDAASLELGDLDEPDADGLRQL
jgi:hypothetical protein